MKMRLVFCAMLISACSKQVVEQKPSEQNELVQNSTQIHQPSGLIIDEGLGLVIANCTSCHSAKLVTQNRATREGWESTIRWMQATQNFWDLGENEEAILDYLARNYAPQQLGRRAPLEITDWYELP